MRGFYIVIIVCLFLGCKKEPIPEPLLIPCYNGLSTGKIVKYAWFDGRDIVRAALLYNAQGKKILDSVLVEHPIIQRRFTYTSDTSVIDGPVNDPLGYYTLNEQGFPVTYFRPGKHLDSAIVSSDGKLLKQVFINFSGNTTVLDDVVYDGNGNIISVFAVYDEPSSGIHYEGFYAFEYITSKTFDLQKDPLGRATDPLVPPFQIYCKNLISKIKMPYSLTYEGHDEFLYSYQYNNRGLVSVTAGTKTEYEFDTQVKSITSLTAKIVYYNCD